MVEICGGTGGQHVDQVGPQFALGRLWRFGGGRAVDLGKGFLFGRGGGTGWLRFARRRCLATQNLKLTCGPPILDSRGFSRLGQTVAQTPVQEGRLLLFGRGVAHVQSEGTVQVLFPRFLILQYIAQRSALAQAFFLCLHLILPRLDQGRLDWRGFINALLQRSQVPSRHSAS